MSGTPLVTVGMPVYNGAATIEGAMRSLLDQTFTDIELLVSDNASSDATSDVVARLAAADARVRYVRQPVNLVLQFQITFGGPGSARGARRLDARGASASGL